MSSEAVPFSSNANTNYNPIAYRQGGWKPHVLNKEELNRIPEPEKKALMTMPVEEGSIWDVNPMKNGRESYATYSKTLQFVAPSFHSMLKGVVDNPNMTHLIFNEYSFTMGRDKVVRTRYTPGTESGSGSGSGPKKYGFFGPGSKPAGAAPPQEKFVSNVFFGEQDKINDFLNEPGNVQKWHLYGDWKIDPTSGKPIVGLFKTQ